MILQENNYKFFNSKNLNNLYIDMKTNKLTETIILLKNINLINYNFNLVELSAYNIAGILNRSKASFSLYYTLNFFDKNLFLLKSIDKEDVKVKDLGNLGNNITSLASIMKGMNWAEREVSEMFGVRFLNNFDSRKLLLDYNYTLEPMLQSNSLSELNNNVYYNIISESVVEEENSNITIL